MSSSPRTIEGWIKGALVDPDKDGPCTALQLCHMVNGSSVQELHMHRIKGTGSHTPKTLAEMFIGKADSYTEGVNAGTQTFVIRAFYGKQEPEGMQPFSRSLTTEQAGQGLVTEPPNATGERAQGMRWNESLLGQVYRRQDRLDQLSISLLERMDKENEKLRRENIEMFGLMKETLAREALNEHGRALELRKFDRTTKLQEQVVKFAPAAINMITGKEILPQSVVDTAIVEAIAEKLTPEKLQQFQMLAAGLGLSDEETGVLMSRFNQVLAKKDLEAQKTKELPRYNGTAEEDISGGTPH